MRPDAAAPALLDFRQISVMRGDKLALDQLSLRVGLGEHVAILSPNGCGKSTLIKTIARECYPLLREGSSVRILGHEVSGRLPTPLAVWDYLSRPDGVLRAPLHGPRGGAVGLLQLHRNLALQITAAMEEKADGTLERLGALHLADRTIDRDVLGRGPPRTDRPRAGARASALLLDEPSTALDLLAQHDAREALRGLARSGIGIVLVTHHLGDIIPEMERVLMLLREGRVLADGDKREVLTVERLSDLFGVPVQLARHDGYYHAW